MAGPKIVLRDARNPPVFRSTAWVAPFPTIRLPHRKRSLCLLRETRRGLVRASSESIVPTSLPGESASNGAVPDPLRSNKGSDSVTAPEKVKPTGIGSLLESAEDSVTTDAYLNAQDPNFCTMYSPRPLPPILVVHCGGTFGMDADASFDEDGRVRAGGTYKASLRPGGLLADILEHFPELGSIANMEVNVPMNLDSSRIGPSHWMKIARLLHKNRDAYDGFVIIHGTDTMSYTASALSLMLAGFGRPVVMTGSQLPMARARSDARQNLVDSVTVACSGVLQEFAVCFGGTLLRANRAQKTSSSAYRAFSSPDYPALATLGVNVEWNYSALWRDPGVYRPRIKLDPSVVRIPVIPGVAPSMAYGNLFQRGVRGAVIESFGVGNLPDQKSAGWMEWLRKQRKEGLEVYLASQCLTGPLNPELYKSGSMAMRFGAKTTRRMTVETAVVKMMLCLAHTDLHLDYPLAGEL